MSTAKNRQAWNNWSSSYQNQHGPALEAAAMAWGVWRIPETEVQILGPVDGRDVLELGCGGAQWSVALAGIGARAVGFDLSERQLSHAQGYAARAGITPPLVQGDAEELPFAGGSFDIVFCDHGAMTFARPDRTIAEAARVLRPSGLLAFCTSTPIRDICWNSETSLVELALKGDYFDLFEWSDEDAVEYQLPYGSWIRLFNRHALAVEDLVELRPPQGAATTYEHFVTLEWSRRWPAEHIWKVRKR